MVSFYKRFLNVIDIYGVELQFRKEDKNTYNFLIGSFMSVMIYISLVVLSFIFGKEIYERKLPKVNSGFEVLNPNNTDINLKREFPFSFVLRSSVTTESLRLNEYFTIDVRIWDLTNAEIANIFYLNETIFSPCTPNYFSAQEDIGTIPGFNEFYCVDWKDYFVRNEKSNPNSYFITMEIKLCDSTKQTCPKDLALKTAQMFSNSIFQDSYINPKSKNSLINTHLIKNPQNLNSETIKYTNYRIIKNRLVIDNGWILEDNVDKFHINTNVISETLVKSNKNLKTIQVLNFDTSTNRIMTEIRYMKVQDLLANIGGLMNGLIMIGSILVKNYISFVFYIDTYDLIIDFHKNSIVSNEEIFYKDLISKKDEINNIGKIHSMKLKISNNDINKDEIKNKVGISNQNQSNTKILSNKENVKNPNTNEIVNIMNNSKFNESFVKDSSILNLRNNINFINNSINISNETTNINNSKENLENFKKIVSEEIKTKFEEIENGKLDIQKTNLQNHLSVIENSNEFEFVENYFIFLYESYLCCRSPNKKQINLSNYMLSYDRFVKHSMMGMAYDK